MGSKEPLPVLEGGDFSFWERRVRNKRWEGAEAPAHDARYGFRRYLLTQEAEVPPLKDGQGFLTEELHCTGFGAEHARMGECQRCPQSLRLVVRRDIFAFLTQGLHGLGETPVLVQESEGGHDPNALDVLQVVAACHHTQRHKGLLRQAHEGRFLPGPLPAPPSPRAAAAPPVAAARAAPPVAAARAAQGPVPGSTSML